MKNKTAIFVLTHGSWGEALINSTRMVIGNINDVYAFSLEELTEIDFYVNKIEEKMKELSGYDFLILTDILGGTPSNVAGKMSIIYDIEAISGLNMQLLIDSVELRKNFQSEELTQKILINRKNDCKDIKKICRELISI